VKTANQWIRDTANDARPYITFVVKGSEMDAREQMFKRGIVAQTINQTKFEFVFKAETKHYDAIAKWFGESPELIEGYGYPNGTCLIYSTHEVQL
jgi:hypothetical protein